MRAAPGASRFAGILGTAYISVAPTMSVVGVHDVLLVRRTLCGISTAHCWVDGSAASVAAKLRQLPPQMQTFSSVVGRKGARTHLFLKVPERHGGRAWEEIRGALKAENLSIAAHAVLCGGRTGKLWSRLYVALEGACFADYLSVLAFISQHAPVVSRECELDRTLYRPLSMMRVAGQRHPTWNDVVTVAECHGADPLALSMCIAPSVPKIISCAPVQVHRNKHLVIDVTIPVVKSEIVDTLCRAVREISPQRVRTAHQVAFISGAIKCIAKDTELETADLERLRDAVVSAAVMWCSDPVKGATLVQRCWTKAKPLRREALVLYRMLYSLAYLNSPYFHPEVWWHAPHETFPPLVLYKQNVSREDEAVEIDRMEEDEPL